MKLKLRVFLQMKENLYLILALIFGVIMVFLNPPFAGVPDEPAHFLRASSIAQGNIACGSNNTLDSDTIGLAEELKPIKISGSKDKKISLGKIKNALFEKDNREQIKFGGAVCGSNPLGYFPQAMGVGFAKILDIPVLWGFYFGRLFNMLSAVFITYFALRMLPFGKIVFLTIALLPMTMQQYSSFSYDALHISMIFFFSSLILSLAVKEERITRNEMITLSLIAVLAANIKWGFIPVLFLLLTLPIKNFKIKKNYWIYILCTIFAGLAIFLLAQMGSVASEGSKEGVQPMQQLIFVLKNPFDFLYIVINTIYGKANFFLETFLYKPGWLDNSLSPIFYLFTLLGLIILIRNEEEKVSLTVGQRVVLGLTFLAGLLFVFLSLFVFWTKVGADKIQGVQGRYLISIFPIIILTFYKSNFQLRLNWIKLNATKAISIFVSLVFLSAFISLWLIYYAKNIY